MAVTIAIQGVDELLQQMGEIDKGSRVVVRRAIRSSASKIRTRARKLAPHSPLQAPIKRPPSKSKGDLRKSIGVQQFNKGMSAAIGTDDEKGPWHEFGTRKMPARPFLGPAFEQEAPKVVANIVGHLNRHFARVAGKGGAPAQGAQRSFGRGRLGSRLR